MFTLFGEIMSFDYENGFKSLIRLLFNGLVKPIRTTLTKKFKKGLEYT